MREYQPDDLLPLLRAACEGKGKRAAFARKAGISRALVTQTLAGDVPLGPAVAAALGYQKKMFYTPLQGQADAQ